MKVPVSSVAAVVRALSEYQTALNAEQSAQEAMFARISAKQPMAEEYEQVQRWRGVREKDAGDAITALTDLTRRLLLAQGLDLDSLVEAHRAGKLDELLQATINAINVTRAQLGGVK